MFLGIDHGAKGALAAIKEDGEIDHVIRMPYKDSKIDCFQVYSWLYENYGDYEHEVVACGEELRAIFRAAASSTFSFGKNVGKIVGIIECLDMDYEEVRAVDWQRFMFTSLEIPETHLTKKTPSGKLKKDTKVMALQAANKLWGDRIEKQYKNHDGIIDALLIAEYARRKENT